ncbi:MAG: hypothetical protein ABW023_10240 [Sphingomonas sp.]
MPEEDDSFTRWIEACAAGELLGIASAALWWVTCDRFDPHPDGLTAQILMLIAKGGSGVIQGIVLGYLQGWALRRPYPRLIAGRWVMVTTVTATLGWTLAAWLSIFGLENGPQTPVLNLLQTALTAAVFGVVTGLVFGSAQALVLRGVAHRSHWWIVANAIGWGLALPCIYIAASVGSAQPGSLEIAFRGLVGGVASGVVLGLVTGLSFSVMPSRHPASEHIDPRF